jgi:hypothetical protein
VENLGTCAVTNSTIAGNTAGDHGGGVHNFGTLTVTNSTISGNSAPIRGGGLENFGFLTVTHSTISGNTAGFIGGGISDLGYFTVVTNSTISGNTAGGGGGLSSFSAVTVTNSTISGNTAGSGGGILTDFTLTLARTLVSGNTASTGPEIYNYSGSVYADNHNLFGFNGNAGLVGFSPGPTDIVPVAGVFLPDILDPTLADNGGPTPTHALVPSSPAIDAGGPVCTDVNGNPLLTDQRGQPRVVDGNQDGIAACDIGAFEFASDQVTPGDLDGDGDVDRADITLLLGDRGNSVAQSACGPPCDLDGDGQITALDARMLTLLCTRPGCATE